MAYYEHHIWCNNFMLPAEGCEMCKGLRERYPEGDQTPDELVKKHFPDVVVIPSPNPSLTKDL